MTIKVYSSLTDFAIETDICGGSSTGKFHPRHHVSHGFTKPPIAIGFSNGALGVEALLATRPKLQAGAILFRPVSLFGDGPSTRLGGLPEVDLSIRTWPWRQAGFMRAVIRAVDQAGRVESWSSPSHGYSTLSWGVPLFRYAFGFTILNNQMYRRLKIHPVASGIHASREITEGLIGCLGSSLVELINQDVGQRCWASDALLGGFRDVSNMIFAINVLRWQMTSLRASLGTEKR